jgi:hypothetical protein
MMRIYAATISACVIEIKMVFHISNQQLVDDAMCDEPLAFPMDLAMSFACSTTKPVPAAIFVDAYLFDDPWWEIKDFYACVIANFLTVHSAPLRSRVMPRNNFTLNQVDVFLRRSFILHPQAERNVRLRGARHRQDHRWP